LKPEFLNRLSEIVIFETLPRDKLKEIVKIQINKLVASVASRGIFLLPSDAALDVIFSESYKPVSGICNTLFSRII
jgi:ATP-dependent Clp protease ATP-binding subunit ClpA